MTSNQPPQQQPQQVAHTYIAGEDEQRLAQAAQHLGLHRDEARLPSKNWWAALLHNDSVSTSAFMHSVGVVASNERVDEYGTLWISVQRKRHRKAAHQQYDQLTDLFAAPTPPGRHQPPTASERGGGAGQLLSLFGPEEAPENDDDAGMEDGVEEVVEGGSLGAAAFGIVKGIVGPAILYLPSAFYKSGWAVAIPAMIFAASAFIYNAYRLLECWRVETDRNHQVENRMKEVQALLQYNDDKNMKKNHEMMHNNNQANQNNNNNNDDDNTPLQQSPQQPPTPQYGATAVQQVDSVFKAKLLSYPELAHRALGPYSIFVDLGISLMQFGVCLTYLIFVPANLYECGRALGFNNLSKLSLLWIMIAMEIPICWIRDIRKLTPTNVVASFLIAFGLLAVLGLALYQGVQMVDSHDGGEQEMAFVQNIQTLQPITKSWFLMIGTAFFMMEGSITLIVPLQQAVYRREDQDKFPNLYRNCLCCIIIFYITFSIITCAAFGSHIKTALTASLTGTLATIVQFAYSIAVILTFPLQAFPAMEVAVPMLIRMTPGGGGGSSSSGSGGGGPTRGRAEAKGWKRNIYATAIVVTLGFVAMVSINYLGNIVSILGSLFGIPLGLIFPPILHNRLVRDSPPATKLLNLAVALVGLLVMITASYITIVTWDEGAEK